ncbi:MAG: amidase [Saprospiraceae bacterium]|nr:amidase [Saprospiraceae bacterium]
MGFCIFKQILLMKQLFLLLTAGLLLTQCKTHTYQEVQITEATTVASLQQAYADNTYRIQDVVQAYLDRIAQLDDAGPTLNAVIITNPDALAIAKELDAELKAGKVRGPLHGIPILLKDNIATKDNMPTTAGSNALKNSFTNQDSFIAAELRKAGAVILGKTNLSEWANFRGQQSVSGWSAVGGQTKNPYILANNPCGSSSGSGAAVSANLAPIAIGTETNGSIVCPSHANGIVGIKPTVGLVSRTGIIPISYSQDTAGPMAKTLEDAVILLSALTAEDPKDLKTKVNRGVETDYSAFLNKTGLEGKRIGWWQESQGINSEVDSLLLNAIDELKAQGAEIIPIEKIFEPEVYSASFNIMLAEYEVGLNDYFQTFANIDSINSLEDVIAYNLTDSAEMTFYKQEYLEQALEHPNTNSEKYKADQATIQLQARVNGLDRVLKDNNLDAIIAPTGAPAWPTDYENGDNYSLGSSSPAAITGYPNITVPMGFIGDLPVGISFFGDQWQEGKLIEMAYGYEQATLHRKEPKFIIEGN